MPLYVPEHNTIRVTASGTVASDTADLQTAFTKMGAVNGTVVLDGQVIINANIDIKGGASFLGMNNATVLKQHVTGGALFWWNDNVTIDNLVGSAFDATANAGAREISSVGHPVSKGDWFAIWDNSIVQGVHPHFGTGDGQHPLELHNASEVEVDKIFIEGYTIDPFTAAAGAKAVIIPMSEGVVVDNISFGFDGTPPSPLPTALEFTSCLRFNGCLAPTVTNNVRMLRDSPGDIRFSLCANGKAEADFEGSYTYDRNYAYQCDGVNGLDVHAIVHGTRHPCDTTATRQRTNEYAGLSTNAVTDRILHNSHPFSNGDHVAFRSPTTTGLLEYTDYWIVNAGTNDYQVSLTPGGAPVVLNAGTVTTRWYSRWGTPLGVNFSGVHYMSTKIVPSGDGGGTFERSGANTHQEGYGVNISFDTYVQGNMTTNYACNARARATRFHDMKIIGNYDASEGLNQSGGIRLAASGCRVDNVVLEKLWRPCRVMAWGTTNGSADDQVMNIEKVELNNVRVIDSRFPVQCEYGDNHSFNNVDFIRSSSDLGNSPYNAQALIDFQGTGTGHVVQGGGLYKDTTNDYAIDLGVQPEGSVTIHGANLTGYGPGNAGIGRKIAFASINDGTDVITFVRSHGFVVDDEVEFISEDPTGGFTTGLEPNKKFYVLSVPSTTTMTVSTTQGGSLLDISGSAVGMFVVPTSYREVNQRALLQNVVDRKAELFFQETWIQVSGADAFLDHTASGNWTIEYTFAREGDNGATQYIWTSNNLDSYHRFSAGRTYATARGNGSAVGMQLTPPLDRFVYTTVAYYQGSGPTENASLSGDRGSSPMAVANNAGGETVFTIGARFGGTDPFYGMIRDVKVYSGDALSGIGTLTNWWPIDRIVDDAGTITDIVGGLNGTLTLGKGHWRERR